MGTNFYWYEKTPCECCKREFEPIHIGKSSGGWCFSLHVEPEKGITTLDDWKAKFNAHGCVIKDEYDTPMTAEQMIDRIENRSWESKGRMLFDYAGNHAFEGPNGLLRHMVDGRHCIGNGEGTWDYIVGEFS